MALTVKELAGRDTGFGTAADTDKADYVWEIACENMDLTVVEFVDELGQYVSDSYAREVLEDMPPEAFGL